MSNFDNIEREILMAVLVLLFIGAVLGWFVIKFFQWLPFTIVYTGG